MSSKPDPRTAATRGTDLLERHPQDRARDVAQCVAAIVRPLLAICDGELGAPDDRMEDIATFAIRGFPELCALAPAGLGDGEHVINASADKILAAAIVAQHYVDQTTGAAGRIVGVNYDNDIAGVVVTLLTEAAAPFEDYYATADSWVAAEAAESRESAAEPADDPGGASGDDPGAREERAEPNALQTAIRRAVADAIDRDAGHAPEHTEIVDALALATEGVRRQWAAWQDVEERGRRELDMLAAMAPLAGVLACMMVARQEAPPPGGLDRAVFEEAALQLAHTAAE